MSGVCRQRYPPSCSGSAALGNALLLAILAALCGLLLALQVDARWHVSTRADHWVIAVLILLGFAAVCVVTLRARRTANPPQPSLAPSRGPILVAWASQTGNASEMAERTACSLRTAGEHCRVVDLASIDCLTLAGVSRALFVVSTTGEGDAPDHALPFVRDVLGRIESNASCNLSGLHFAVLALGDREYRHFCGFGRQLDRTLRRAGASTLFDLVEVDDSDPAALRHWQHHLSVLSQQPELPDWSPVRYQSWRLQHRARANPGSDYPAFHIQLTPEDGKLPRWRPGDIAEIGPRNSPQRVAGWLARTGLDAKTVVEHAGEKRPLDEVLATTHLTDDSALISDNVQLLVNALQPLPHREYSIASTADEGSLQLLVRRMQRPDGTPGLGSGWLCGDAALGASIALRIRSNPNFHPPDADRPLILIGNGTGIAGLRAHISARVAAGQHRNWLLFGERHAAQDFHFGNDIRRWHRHGQIERLDTVFSRDGGPHRYVQDLLLDAESALRDWVADDASILVCGSLQGMAPGVDTALRNALGATGLESLREAGRYRRDVY